MKAELKKKAYDYEEEMLKLHDGKDKTEQDRIEIVFNLNLIVPENLKSIEKHLFDYMFSSEIICKILINEIIKKAWDQPKYASTYAKLCQDFTKRHPGDFKYEGGKKDKENPFKFFLVEKVQHSFDEKMDPFPKFES